MSDGQKIMRRIAALANITDEPGKITRTFASHAMRRANELVAKWMREAGMETHVDAIGNVIGHYAGKKSNAEIFLLGSHLDTVRDAGKYDGPLGVILAIACVEELHRKKIRLPFAIEVVGFSDEEGVRFHTAYLGSNVLAGCFDQKDLKRKDANGISMADAIRDFGGDPTRLKSARLNSKKIIGYLEAHIEQGPVLEEKDLAVGVVSAIAGQTRAKIIFKGRAGHAGTTPMPLRKDALCASAEFVLAAENLARKTHGLAATIGQIQIEHGASNVIPGEARMTLDLRHAKDSVRASAYRSLKSLGLQIARRRKTPFNCAVTHETPTAACSKTLSALLGFAVKRHQKKIIFLSSGAGHDAAVMAKITPTAMLFIRCKGGISHHPDESVNLADVRVAFAVMNDFILQLAKKS